MRTPAGSPPGLASIPGTPRSSPPAGTPGTSQQTSEAGQVSVSSLGTAGMVVADDRSNTVSITDTLSNPNLVLHLDSKLFVLQKGELATLDIQITNGGLTRIEVDRVVAGSCGCVTIAEVIPACLLAGQGGIITPSSAWRKWTATRITGACAVSSLEIAEKLERL